MLSPGLKFLPLSSHCPPPCPPSLSPCPACRVEPSPLSRHGSWGSGSPARSVLVWGPWRRTAIPLLPGKFTFVR